MTNPLRKSGGGSTARPNTFNFAWDDIEDDDELLSAIPLPKRFKYTDDSSVSLHGQSHQPLLPLTQSSSSSETTNRPFEESKKPLQPSLLPPEFEEDILLAASYMTSSNTMDTCGYCSSSSEFEEDDDSDDESSSASSSPEAVSATTTALPIPNHEITTMHTNYPSSADSEHGTRLSASPSLISPPPKLSGQHAITNYFGISLNDGSTLKPTRIALPNASVFTKKSKLPNSAVSHIAILPTPPPASSTDNNSYIEWEKEGSYWSTKPPPVRDQCPFYKRIAGTNFIVDDFRFAYVQPKTISFFLSHFHSDHYGGLNVKFDRGIIYCSPITAALVITSLGVPAQYVHPIPFRTPTLIDKVEVTLYEANHCPGAAVLLFNVDGVLHLHTGDFRFDPKCPDHQTLLGFAGRIGNLYLDTTYADPRYAFPPQQDVISGVIDLLAPYSKDPKVLFVVGTYTIGKEKIFLAAAESFGLRFHSKPYKLKILKCLGIDNTLRESCTLDENEARIHILPIGDLSLKKLAEYLDARPLFNRIVALRPTGWSFSTPKKKTVSPSILSYTTSSSTGLPPKLVPPKQGFSSVSSRKGSIVIHSVPYSEHSSFDELCTFVRTIKSRWIIPTVNNRSRDAVTEMVSLLRGDRPSSAGLPSFHASR